ncbi:MAG TPA: SulP family inorganic anion transporter, partial [Candidatus Edwardsbacteria bacterium]|nr:SulP family inorganic anion transporter [Candidatus Edwardsbacteria bacterium]
MANDHKEKRGTLSGDLFGGLAAMLVAFPSALAFGLVVFAPLGAEMAGAGAFAGMVGAIALGLVAPLLGGTPRLISAPSAPAAAVMAAFVAERAGAGAGTAVLLATLAALLAGLLQFGFGALGGGRLMKYIPYPVVAGYLSGVGLLIIITQLPKFLGLAKGVDLWHGLLQPLSWSLPAIVVGVIAMTGMSLASRLTRAIPAPIIALAAGVAAYFGLSLLLPELRTLAGNRLVIGSIPTASLGVIAASFAGRWNALRALDTAALTGILLPAGTLAVLLSIDTLKSSLVVDALTRSRHNSNRELIGQGVGNMASALLGGIPGSGTMGATLVNISSGGRSRVSGLIEGLFSLGALLLLGSLVSWIPVAALAGILLVVAFRMIDRKSLFLLKQRSTAFDFAVIAAVAVTAVSVNLIAAAGVGLGLAIALFIRDQVRTSVVRRLAFGNQIHSKRHRIPDDLAMLESRGGQTAVYELQGALFFGTTDQLFSLIEPRLAQYKYVILDMRRVAAVDFTAIHMLEMLDARIAEQGGNLIFSQIPRNLPTGLDLRQYFDQVGLMRPERSIKVFPELDAALEWVEDRVIAQAAPCASCEEQPLDLAEIDLLADVTPEGLALLRQCAAERTLPAGERLFRQGETGDEIFIIRKGEVRIELPLSGREAHHLATFGRGDFFGEIAFLDRGTRSADAVAATEAMIYSISRGKFDGFARQEPALAGMIFSGLARVLAIRLRHADA